MDQLKDLADVRLLSGCVYCGGPEETRDHVPSRVLLDAPFPSNLPVVPACWSCNNGFARDEEYLACLLESVLAGTADPSSLNRPRIGEILRRSPALRERIESSKRVVDGKTIFEPEMERVRNVLRKLAIGHSAFELSLVPDGEPATVWTPLLLMCSDLREQFEAAYVSHLLGEIGSRGVQRTFVTMVTLENSAGEIFEHPVFVSDWVEVQEGCYRYLAIDQGHQVTIRMVLRDYLACEVTWLR